jgi:hypothetical protein
MLSITKADFAYSNLPGLSGLYIARGPLMGDAINVM